LGGGIEVVEQALELWVGSFLEETLVVPFGDGVAVFADQCGDVAEQPSRLSEDSGISAH
jgi:hypothetical protein